MSTTVTLFNQKFVTTASVKKEVHQYLSLIDDNYDTETAKELKVSFADSLNKLSRGNEVTSQMVNEVITKIGVLQKPIYKSFFRYRGLFGGVCDGIATYFNISIWWPRLIFGFPLILTLLFLIDTFKYAAFPEIPASYLVFWNEIATSDASANINYGYQLKPFVESLLEVSVIIVIIYILAWLFLPKATTEFEIKQLKSKWEYADELEKSIFNKITFKNQLIRRLVTKLFLNIAKFGVFLFDVGISIVNNLFTSTLFKILIWLLVSVFLLIVIFNLMFMVAGTNSSSQ